jgi:predicted alpha/beta hydrolase
VQDLEIAAADAYPLSASWFETERPASAATVVISSATGVLRRYYRPFAEYLTSLGFDALTFDYRGIGESRPKSLRALEATLTDWGRNDIEGVIRHLSVGSTRRPILLVGHSVGGQALGLVPSVAEIRAAVLITTQSAYWRHWSGLSRMRMWTLWHLLVPAITGLLGYFPAKSMKLCEDLPAGAALEWAYWGRHRDYLLRVPGRSETYGGLNLPILALSFTDDHYAPKASVTDFLSRFASADLEHLNLDPTDIGATEIGHFGFFRERFRETLWPVVGSWLTHQVGVREGKELPT